MSALIALPKTDAAGVSLKLQGIPIPNNSLVDVNDLLYRAPFDVVRESPTNANGLHNQTLLCETDLIDCCASPRTVHGDWFFPDGRVVPFNNSNLATFQANKGPNEVINGQQFLGSVRFWRQYSRPPGRGRFYCELPSAADPNVNQIFYVIIGKFYTCSVY